MILYLSGWHYMAKRFPELKSLPPKGRCSLETALPFLLKNVRPYKGLVKPPIPQRVDRFVNAWGREVSDHHIAGDPLMLDSGGYGLLYSLGLISGASTASPRLFRTDRIARDNALSLWASDVGNLDAYANNYYRILSQMPEVTCYAELDIEDLSGPELIGRWRDDILQRGDQHRCLVVSHATAAVSLAYETDRVEAEGWYGAAFPNAVGGSLRRSVDKLRTGGSAAHGFGIASWDEAVAAPYTSLDSTRWDAPVRWGRSEVWNATWRVWERPSIFAQMCPPGPKEDNLCRQVREHLKFVESVEEVWRGR